MLEKEARGDGRKADGTQQKWSREECDHAPDHTPGPQDTGASPEKAPRSHSPGTTCLWLHKTADPK